ncbi:MAG: hypothetical protein ACTSQI_19535 [Candidatus Helarchaeota archaeon]
MPDRRTGKKSGPHIPSKGGAQPKSRTKKGTWRKKRKDAKGPYHYLDSKEKQFIFNRSFLPVIKISKKQKQKNNVILKLNGLSNYLSSLLNMNEKNYVGILNKNTIGGVLYRFFIIQLHYEILESGGHFWYSKGYNEPNEKKYYITGLPLRSKIHFYNKPFLDLGQSFIEFGLRNVIKIQRR